jgi:hypothetical protein
MMNYNELDEKLTASPKPPVCIVLDSFKEIFAYLELIQSMMSLKLLQWLP